MASFREDATRVEIDEDECMVFLYDEENGPAITASQPTVLGFGGEDTSEEEEDRKLEMLARGRLLVCYGLYQDSGTQLEVALGPPLADPELAGASWLTPQVSALSLPSGRLCVDAGRSLGPEQEEARGAVMEVPPGEYVLTLHRLDQDALIRDEPDPWPEVMEVVTLTPTDPAAPVEARAVLYYQPLQVGNRAGDYTIDGDVFCGQAMFLDWDETLMVNMDRAAAEQLGVGHGARLRVELKRPGLQIDTHVLHEDDPDFVADNRLLKKRLTSLGPEVAVASWMQLSDPFEPHYVLFGGMSDEAGQRPTNELLRLERRKAALSIDGPDICCWLPVTITLRG